MIIDKRLNESDRGLSDLCRLARWKRSKQGRIPSGTSCSLLAVKNTLPHYPQIANPKRYLDSAEAEGRKLFPYYAGFSDAFVESTLESICLPNNAKIFDPWNGSGTTTTTALKQGFEAVGSDLNPAMILVAKASLVSSLELESLLPIAHSVIKSQSPAPKKSETDPLCNWFDPQSALAIRTIESSINRTLVSPSTYLELSTAEALDKVTPIAALFYLALFRVTRRLTQNFVASNPTWIKVPKNTADKKHVTIQYVTSLFTKEIELLLSQYKKRLFASKVDPNRLNLILSNAENLPLSTDSIDAVITSPPYCTRIDYAIATYIELAVIGIGGVQFKQLRRSLTGSSTVQKSNIEIRAEWGRECKFFLDALREHPSKASQTYYLKNHLQYFDSLYKSLSEISRVLKPEAPCIIVVQNSYYKEIRNDVALIISEMAESLSLKPTHRADFSSSRSMVDMNTNSKKYIAKRSTIESVLFFNKKTTFNLQPSLDSQPYTAT